MDFDKKFPLKDINSLPAPSHFGCMFAKLSEVQLSNLVIKLLSTICSVEIRWKSRQRRIRSPSVTPSTLYVMSYPLVQFASDSLNSLRNNSVNSQLRINLVALLLTSLSDVCLSNDLQALHELLHHYKVFNKCVAVIQDSFKHSTTVNQTTNVQLTAALLRSFRMTLEKYGNPKAIGK